MEGNESVLNSYYHHHHHHHPTTTTTTTTNTNGMFSPHYSSSEPLVFSPPPCSSTSTTGGGGLGSTVLPSSTPPPPPLETPVVKRKRGRPRKYGTPEGPPTSSSAKNISSPPVKKDSSSSASFQSSSKKSQLVALGNAGQGFTPHIITVAAGEDVAQKIMSFVQQRKCAVCILSASGSIYNASLRQPAMLGGNVTYEGRYEIISLSGSFLYKELGGASSITGGLSVCLSGTDGPIIGGGVGGPLRAAGPVQVIAGSFFFDSTKETAGDKRVEASLDKPPQVVGASITSVTFRPARDFSGRMSIRGNDDHNNVGGNFMVQTRGMDVTSPRFTDWKGGGLDARSGANMEFDGRAYHGTCQSPEDGDDEQLDC